MKKNILIKKDHVEMFFKGFNLKEDERYGIASLIYAIIHSPTPRISDLGIFFKNGVKAASNERKVRRLLPKVDLKRKLNEIVYSFLNCPFIILDPTEVKRPQAYKTSYVGTLKDGKTRGYTLIIASLPYKGRAIPCEFEIYSSKTINQENISRNILHWQVLKKIDSLFEQKTVFVYDRGFSYENFLQEHYELGRKFVIRLNIGNRVKITDKDGNKVDLSCEVGEKKFLFGAYYKGEVEVNLSIWKGFKHKEPLIVICHKDMDPREALNVYLKRMKIEESFRDLKDKMNIEKLMNKKKEYLEEIIAAIFIAYIIILLIGEFIRDRLGERVAKCYSGPHIFFRLNKFLYDYLNPLVFEECVKKFLEIFRVPKYLSELLS